MAEHYFSQNGLTACCTDTTVTLFWDKPTAAGAVETYTILLNDAAAGTTSKTHFTLEHLHPETEYALFVQWRGGGIGELTVHTTPIKHRLDVATAPYFATGDGKTMNTAALQKAIDDCKENECVYFPDGIYMTGALRLHSNMELYLDEGAVLQGTANPEDYLPRIHSRFEGTEMECYSSLLNLGTLDHTAGPNCENVVLRGKGTIASGGKLLASRIIENERERLKEYLAQNAELVSTCENADTIPGRVRPRLVNMSNCRNIWMQGLTFANGASWNLHMIYSDQIVTDHCTIKSDGVWNGDGWDPDSSTNCTLFACEFFTGDDAVAIKSGKNPEGNTINPDTPRKKGVARLIEILSRDLDGIFLSGSLALLACVPAAVLVGLALWMGSLPLCLLAACCTDWLVGPALTGLYDTMILSISVDRKNSKSKHIMQPLSGQHRICGASPWVVSRHWRSKYGDCSNSS